jgi:hypothetical protein
VKVTIEVSDSTPEYNKCTDGLSFLTNIPGIPGHFLVPFVLCYVQAGICNSSSNFKVVPTFLQANQVFPFTQIQEANGTMFHHFQTRNNTVSRLQSQQALLAISCKSARIWNSLYITNFTPRIAIRKYSEILI